MLCKTINLVNAKLEEMYYAILQNLSEQGVCFDSSWKELIDRERNAMDLFDLRDSKGQMQSISSQEGMPIDDDIPLARNILKSAARILSINCTKQWNILDKIFVPKHMQ